MTVWLEIEGKQHRVELPPDEEGGALACVVDGRGIHADVRMLEPGTISLIVEGRQYRCLLNGDAVVIEGVRREFVVTDPRSLQGRRGPGEASSGPRAVKAPMPGRVVRVLVSEGDEVTEQQGLIVIEAMKMQNELKAPRAGRVAKIAVAVDATVDAGSVLVVVE